MLSSFPFLLKKKKVQVPEQTFLDSKYFSCKNLNKLSIKHQCIQSHQNLMYSNKNTHTLATNLVMTLFKQSYLIEYR